MARVAYLGPEGSFSEEAAWTYSGETATLVPYQDLDAVMAAIAERLVDLAVMPIENSIEGSINSTVDQLIHRRDPPRIVGEVNLPVRHCLIGRPGSSIGDIDRIVSVPAAAAQCMSYIHATFPQAPLLAALSTSAAVSSLVHSERLAAIGSPRAAELYGMEVLAADIQDTAENVTRFVALSWGEPARSGRDKTSVLCSIADDRPGSLLSILEQFADRKINLTKIESRPTRGGLGKYFFLIDLEGHQADDSVREALSGVQQNSLEMRVLGSYPQAPKAG